MIVAGRPFPSLAPALESNVPDATIVAEEVTVRYSNAHPGR
jgi:hypothetical protein